MENFLYSGSYCKEQVIAKCLELLFIAIARPETMSNDYIVSFFQTSHVKVFLI